MENGGRVAELRKFDILLRAEPGTAGKGETRAKMITVKDVAERAGVEVKSARYALAGLTMGKRRNARERAERMLKAAEELGDSPSQVALSLRNGRTGSIGFVVGSITNPFFRRGGGRDG